MPSKTAPATFASRLRAFREAAGITRYRLAKDSGLDPSRLGRLEFGEQQPSLEVAGRLADVLKVKVDELRGDK